MNTPISGFGMGVTHTNGTDNDQSTLDTLAVMKGLVESQKDSQSVQSLIDWLQIRYVDTDRQLRAIWNWVKTYIKYVDDDDLMKREGIDPWDKDLIHEPTLLIHQVMSKGYAEGDCDDFSTLIATILAGANERAGISFVVVKTPQSPDPNVWAHVYLAVYYPCGKRVVVDGSHGPFLGWEHSPITDVMEYPIRGVKEKNEVEKKRDKAMLVESNKDLGLAGLGAWGDFGGETDGSMGGGGGVNWGQILGNTINTAVGTAADIFKWQYGPPPAGTIVQTGPTGTSIYRGVDPNTGVVNTPVGTGFGNASSLGLIGLGLVALLVLKK